MNVRVALARAVEPVDTLSITLQCCLGLASSGLSLCNTNFADSYVVRRLLVCGILGENFLEDLDAVMQHDLSLGVSANEHQIRPGIHSRSSPAAP